MSERDVEAWGKLSDGSDGSELRRIVEEWTGKREKRKL